MRDAAEKVDVGFESFLFCFSRGEEKRTSREKRFHFTFFQLTFFFPLFFLVVLLFLCFQLLLLLLLLCLFWNICVCACVALLDRLHFPREKYETTYPVYLPLFLCSDFISIQEALCLTFFINVCFFFFISLSVS